MPSLAAVASLRPDRNKLFRYPGAGTGGTLVCSYQLGVLALAITIDGDTWLTGAAIMTRSPDVMRSGDHAALRRSVHGMPHLPVLHYTARTSTPGTAPK
jgi:hypothetical protein